MALGNVFIYQMQREYGALAVAKTTTVRKLVSVSLSVLWFGHNLSLLQYAAIGTVFAAPLAEKQIDSWNAKETATVKKSPSNGNKKTKKNQ
jgi:UDP-galactose transporter B1